MNPFAQEHRFEADVREGSRALLEAITKVRTWPCGHERTEQNTQRIGKAGLRCRKCRQKIARESARRQHEVRRRKILPSRIATVEHTLRCLRNEAARLGVDV